MSVNSSDSERQTRRHFTAKEKVAILRRHLVVKVPVSQFCKEQTAPLMLFLRRLQQQSAAAGFENAPLAQSARTRGRTGPEMRRFADIEEYQS